MRIQIGHSRYSDYQTELYDPIKNAPFFSEHTWIFPHDGQDINSRQSLKTVDLFIAEVSNSAMGLGIELGFASIYEKKILCIYKKGSCISGSLKYVTDNCFEYENSEDMIQKIAKFL